MGVSKAVYNGKTLIDLTADTVTETKLLSGYTAHKADGTIINGSITTNQGGTYIPGTTDQVIAEDEYLYGNIVLKGDPNLLAENIREGITIFGVTGTWNGKITGTDIIYFNSIDSICTNKTGISSTKLGKGAIFGGGVTVSGSSFSYDQGNDFIDRSLTRITAPNRSYVQGECSLTTSGDDNTYAIFAGGDKLNGSTRPTINSVEAISSSLVRTSITNLLQNSIGHASISFNQYAIFASERKIDDMRGAYYYNCTNQQYPYVETYNGSLTKSRLTNLAEKVSFPMGGNLNDKYAVIAGGLYDTCTSSGTFSSRIFRSYIQIYNESLTRTNLLQLTDYNAGQFVELEAGDKHSACIGEYLIMFPNVYNITTINVINESLTKSTIVFPGSSHTGFSVSTVGNFLVCGGGAPNPPMTLDESLTFKTLNDPIPSPDTGNTTGAVYCSESFGEYLVFGLKRYNTSSLSYMKMPIFKLV